MNRSQQVRSVYALLRSLHGNLPAGELIRIAALIVEAHITEYDEQVIPYSTPYSYASPVDKAIEDGGWRILYADGRSNYCLWDEEPDAADLTYDRIKRLTGKVEWPRITNME